MTHLSSEVGNDSLPRFKLIAAATLYFLGKQGHRIPEKLPKPEIIRFCLEIAGENMRIAAGEDIQPKTIAHDQRKCCLA